MDKETLKLLIDISEKLNILEEKIDKNQQIIEKRLNDGDEAIQFNRFLTIVCWSFPNK